MASTNRLHSFLGSLTLSTKIVAAGRRGVVSLSTLVALVTLFFCQACAVSESAPTIDPVTKVPAQNFHFKDGGQAIFFTVDKGPPATATVNAETILFVISGSDCTSMQYFLPQYFTGLEGESGPIRIFILQKRFIEERTWGRNSGCSRDFIKADHPSQWIADQSEFILAQLDQAARRNASPKRIVIAGISEGGDIVPVLARRIPGVTHAVIIANGGMNPIDAYRLQVRKRGLIDVLRDFDPIRHRPADPDAEINYLGGRTWRYWEELNQLQHTDDLVALSIPIWMAMGDADESVPVESALFLRDRFQKENKTNLTLIIYPGADHSLQRRKYFFITDFWRSFNIIMRDSFG